ncbi:metal ABC transporter permease [Corticibacter populi]|uniref:Metal ABC transporter permease n=1 Tax=Corticibacter populi TaxID=1550736 RepID=A0A3M6QHM6_9BURK|nr:metal ABC transporter permease [Corticibacter populi]RMX02604.1 metal ABC transporter permease [Corticibacter populi]RZS32982.1 manganese/iron transport system permease protein [Corticibacter populi]
MNLDALLDTLLLPLQFDFMHSAFLIAAIVAVPTALLSCYLVLKGWALLGDAISHAIFPGVVLAYLLGLPYLLGAFAAGMACALAIGYLQVNSRVKEDTIMGIVFSGMFALGLLLYVWIRSDVHLDHILFGDMLGVDVRDLAESGAIAVAIGLWIALKWRDLLLYTFDPMQARTTGLPVAVLHYGLLAAVSLAVVGALKAVGLVLAIALLIAPGAIAFLLTRSFGWMLLLAVLIAVVAALAGVYLSFFLDSAPGPTIVLLFTAGFVLALLWQQLRGHRSRPHSEA